MSASEIERTLVRLAHEIVERNNGCANLGSSGIKRRGVSTRPAHRQAHRDHRENPVDTGVLDISFYSRRPLHRRPRPIVEKGEHRFDVNGSRHHPDGRRALPPDEPSALRSMLSSIKAAPRRATASPH